MYFKLEQLINELVKYFPLNEEVLNLLRTSARVETLKRKSFFVQKGETKRTAAFVNKGLVKSYMLDSYGQQHILSFFKEKDWMVDLHCLTYDQPSLANFEALEDTELVLFEFDQVEHIKKVLPESLKIITNAMQKKLAYLYEDRFRLISLNAENRYRNFVEQNGDFLQRLSQKDIAAYLGILPESLSRIRRNIATK